MVKTHASRSLNNFLQPNQAVIVIRNEIMKSVPSFLSSILLASILLFQPSCKPRSNAPSTTKDNSSAQFLAVAPANPVSPQPSPDQTVSNSAQQTGGNGFNYAQRAKECFEQMKTALALTDDQTQKAQSIMDQRHSDMQAFRANQS